jgi:hypothetical protein
MTDMDVEDPLKPLDQIYEPDERQQFIPATLEQRHRVLSEIRLNGSVPVQVRQLFETAKNLSLYSWFAYRFHQVSELISFTALEMALRDRFLTENPPQADSTQRAPSLHALLQHAKVNKWITNEGFPSLYEQARLLAEHNKVLKILQEHDFEEEPIMPIEEAGEEEIAAAIADMDMAEAVANNANKIRNNLAHGSSTLHPGSVTTLRINAEVINQIYPPRL